MNLVWRQRSYPGATLREMADHFCAENLFVVDQQGPAEIAVWAGGEGKAVFVARITDSANDVIEYECRVEKGKRWYNVFHGSRPLPRALQ